MYANQPRESCNQFIAFFSAWPKEARAWTVKRGTKAPAAGGVIHSDFERGFIRAETISYDDFVALGGEQEAREAGRMRAAGRDCCPWRPRR